MVRVAKRSICAVAAALLVLLLAMPAAALTANDVLHLCVLPAKPGMRAASLLAHPERFDCRRSQRSYGSGDYWVLSPPLSRRPAIAVESASLWQDRVTLHVRYADGAIRRTGFTSATTGSLLQLGARIRLPIPQHRAAPVRLLWHVEGAANMRGIVVGAAVIGGADARQEYDALAIFYAAFAGLIGGLFIYNLALLVALRQMFQAAYSVLLFCLLGYAASTSGVLGQLLPALDNNDRLRLNAILLASCATAALIFARTFFERRIFAGWLDPAVRLVAAGLMGSALIYAVLAPFQVLLLDRLMIASYLALMALVPGLLFEAWRQRSNYLWVFAIAWGLPIAAGGLRVAHGLGLLRWHFWLDQSTIVSMGLEAVLSSVGIAYRLKLIQRQRDQARENEAVARALADLDPLTGLLNRRAFLTRAVGREGPQTLLLADLDHFKGVNETIGHDGGDEVLRSVARTLRDAVPADALVARIGGEEFAVIADVGAGLAAGTVLAALRRAPMPFDLAVTTSIGTCTGRLTQEEDWKRLYRQADRALYAAKAAGRDRARDAEALSFAA